MAFSPVPGESRSQIRKAGKLLAGDACTDQELRWALDLADRWRACHAYAINTFQATLRGKLKHYRQEPIAAQRLKRMPTIIDKLRRYPAMKLTTMQDIGGVRAILNSVADVDRLANEYRNAKNFAHELINEYDYISDPRSEDGYRSLHLIYRYRNKRFPAYDGLRVELQIRTKLQHIWATAVETMGTFLGQALKSRQGDQEWLDFFALISSAFARQERRTPVPRYSHLSRAQTLRGVADAERDLGALEKMRGFSVAAQAISQTRRRPKSWHYHLIILNSLQGSVQINAYDRESWEQAVADYARVEAQAAAGAKIEPVLVSAGPFEKLQRAYPNFFLDIGDFIKKVTRMISQAK